MVVSMVGSNPKSAVAYPKKEELEHKGTLLRGKKQTLLTKVFVRHWITDGLVISDHLSIVTLVYDK